MKNYRLRTVIFLALCCDLGLFAKRLISPLTNIVTDALHVPGGIATSFSLMFLVIAVILVPGGFCGTLMGAVQSVIALSFGMVGSMGALAPVGYIVPGLVIDLVLKGTAKTPLSRADRMALANGLAAISAAATANLIVFRLSGVVLALHACIALSSGILCGLLGAKIAQRLTPVIGVQIRQDFKIKPIKDGVSV